MSYLYFILFYLLSAPIIFAQTFGDYISKNAIPVNSTRSLDSSSYKHFKDFSLIMVGEMHGTQEPAKLVQAIAELILQNEKAISVGLEIPNEEMLLYLKNPTDSNLRSTTFFAKENVDGRNGEAWYELIQFCNSNEKIHLFFFDNFESMNLQNRDSAMYLNLVQQQKNFPNNKILTLSGNIHNRIIPFRSNHTMGSFCALDTITFSPNSICSINHIYSEGTMLNNTGNGLELRTINFQKSVYSEATDYENYLLFYQTHEPSENNCIFYTHIVHYSEVLE